MDTPAPNKSPNKPFAASEPLAENRPPSSSFGSSANNPMHSAESSDAVESAMEGLSNPPRQWMASSRDFVRNHPLTVLGAALAAGAVLSNVMSRRSHTD